MKTKTVNPHAWLFAHLRAAHGYDNIDEARKALVFDYSDGKTDSLSELFEKYPTRYRKMRADLSAKSKGFDPQYNQARKRVLKVFYVNLERNGYKNANNEYVKAMICRATKYDRFNDIPLDTLKIIYRKFGEKNAATHKDWVDAMLESIADN